MFPLLRTDDPPAKARHVEWEQGLAQELRAELIRRAASSTVDEIERSQQQPGNPFRRVKRWSLRSANDGSGHPIWQARFEEAPEGSIGYLSCRVEQGGPADQQAVGSIKQEAHELFESVFDGRTPHYEGATCVCVEFSGDAAKWKGDPTLRATAASSIGHDATTSLKWIPVEFGWLGLRDEEAPIPPSIVVYRKGCDERAIHFLQRIVGDLVLLQNKLVRLHEAYAATRHEVRKKEPKTIRSLDPEALSDISLTAIEKATQNVSKFMNEFSTALADQERILIATRTSLANVEYVALEAPKPRETGVPEDADELPLTHLTRSLTRDLRHLAEQIEIDLSYGAATLSDGDRTITALHVRAQIIDARATRRNTDQAFWLGLIVGLASLLVGLTQILPENGWPSWRTPRTVLGASVAAVVVILLFVLWRGRAECRRRTSDRKGK